MIRPDNSCVQCVWPAGATLGEGPCWVGTEAALYWVDIKNPAIHRFHPASGARRSWPMPELTGCIARRRNGGWVAGLKSGFAFVTLDDEARIERIANPEPDRPDNRFNDGKCDAAGRLWAGTMDNLEREATGWLYRLDPDLTWSRHDGPYVCTNGPSLSADGRTLYHTDTVGRIVYAFDLRPDGSLANKRVFFRVVETDGYPDGMTVDAEGFVWIAHWGGWRLTRVSPEGKINRAIRMPVAQVTSCAFGGANLETLYVTSAAIGLYETALRAQPLAGGLFALDVGVHGLPAAEFAG